MSHTIRDKQKLKARASKIQGQVVALKKMLDEPHECAAVLQQIAAIRGAVNGLMREVIKGHLTEHIVHQGDELKREEDLDVCSEGAGFIYQRNLLTRSVKTARFSSFTTRALDITILLGDLSSQPNDSGCPSA